MTSYSIGAVYVIESEYTEEMIENDLQTMQRHGFNLITIWPAHNPWLTDRADEWVFTTTLKVLDICERLAMKAIVQLFGQNHSYEFMPDYLISKDMYLEDTSGQNSANCFWVNLNHPKVMDYMDRHFERCINALKDKKAVYAWDVFNEAHMNTDDDITLALYREWLREKYQSINGLNRKWCRRFTDFSQITPRLLHNPYNVWSSVLPVIDYNKFKSENLTQICAKLVAMVKKYDASHPVLVDSTSGNIIAKNSSQRNNDDYQIAKLPDIYGGTLYPKSTWRCYQDSPWKMALYYEITASAAQKAGKPYMVTELQTHTQAAFTPGSEVTPSELYDWILMNVFCGAAGIQLWRWRPFIKGAQATGRGLTEMDGSPNQRAEAVKNVTALLLENNVFHDSSRKEPVVKIAFSFTSKLFFDYYAKAHESLWESALEGWYKLFWGMGVETAFTNLEELGEADMAAPVLVVPSGIALSDAVIDKLIEYVARGGTLIADCRLGMIDFSGTAPMEGIPGKRLSALFGIREKDVASGGEFEMNAHKLDTSFMYQILQASEDAQVIGKMSDGLPAVIKKEHGMGKTLYFNTFMGSAIAKNEAVYADMKSLMLAVVANNTYVEKNDSVHIAYLRCDAKTAVLAINFSNQTQSVTIKNLAENDCAKDIISEQGYQIRKQLSLTLAPLQKSVLVIGERDR